MYLLTCDDYQSREWDKIDSGISMYHLLLLYSRGPFGLGMSSPSLPNSITVIIMLSHILRYGGDSSNVS